MTNPEQKLLVIFNTIFSKVQKRALSQEENERLTLELERLNKVIEAIAASAVAKKIKDMETNVMTGFDMAGKDMDKLEERVKRMEELVVRLAGDDGR